jgi:hypothetical protein
MNWKPADDIDREIQGWMKAKGWTVTGAEYDEEIYIWRARSARSGHSPALRISQEVLEEYPASSSWSTWTV